MFGVEPEFEFDRVETSAMSVWMCKATYTDEKIAEIARKAQEELDTAVIEKLALQKGYAPLDDGQVRAIAERDALIRDMYSCIAMYAHDTTVWHFGKRMDELGVTHVELP